MQQSISRRNLLTIGASLGLQSALGIRLRALAAGVPNGLPSFDEVSSWQHRLIEYGTRYTGTTGESRYVDFLAEQIERSRLTVQTDRLTFTRWEPRRWSLQDDGAKALPVASYFPYSGNTPPQGISARAVYCGTQITPTSFRRPDGTLTADAATFFAPARGNIALIDVELPIMEFSDLMKPVSFASRADKTAWPTTIVNTVLGGHFNPPAVIAARNEGVRAVICAWTNISDGAAQDQYAPFDTPYQGLPALWVNRTTAARLKELDQQQRTIALTLEATQVAGAASRSLWFVLPGTDRSENVIVNTHTDGGNIMEENGGLALLALARYFSNIPRSQRRRDMVFAFITGHFQKPQFTTPDGAGATSSWKAAHPDLWQKAVAGVTIEHLGCQEWTDDSGTESYHATHKPEWSLTYTTTGGQTTSTTRESASYIDAARATRNPRGVAVVPAGGAPYFGEGAQFWHDRIPTISHIPIPSHLLQAGQDLGLSKLDVNLMYTQIQTFAQVLTLVNSLTAGDLRAKP